MAKLAMILTVISSLFLLSLARNSIDLALQIETPDESNTSLTLESPNLNQSTDIEIPDPIKQELAEKNPDQSTDIEILDPIKQEKKEEEEKQAITLPLIEEFPESHLAAALDESDPGIIIGWDPKVEKEDTKEEKVMKKKKCYESDSDSDSDNEEEEERKMKKKKSKKAKKGGFLRWFWKLIDRFD